MNIHQLSAFIMLLGCTRHVGFALDWIELCYNSTIFTESNSSDNGNNSNGNNGNNDNGTNGNDNGNGNSNGTNGYGSGNNGNGNGNNANNPETNVDFYVQTICDARIASFITNCTDTLPAFTLDNTVPNSGAMVLVMTPVTNLDCSHMCAFLSECVFFTYEPSGSSCQIYIAGSDTPPEPVVWRKTVL